MVLTQLIDPDNNIAAILYDENMYVHTDELMATMIVVMVVSLAIYFGCLFIRKYIGVEMIVVVQMAYVGCVIVDYWPPLLSVYA